MGLWGYKVCYYTGDNGVFLTFPPISGIINITMLNIQKNKVCKDCHLTLPIEIFQKVKKKKWQGYSTSCKPCLNKKARELHNKRKSDPIYRERQNFNSRKNRERNPRSYERRKREWLKSLYKMTLEDYNRLFLSQNGVCAICQKECKTKRGLSIDHNHLCCAGNRSCGKCIRGLLCSNCNRAIGMLQEDIAIFNRAIAYLTSPQK